MKIFFVASIHGKKRFGKNYKKIVEYLEELGHDVEADHVIGISKKDIDRWDDTKDIKFHKKVLTGIRKSDLIVAELSYTSTSVGYLISVAIESNKPTIAFYGGSEIPHLLTTLEKSERFQVAHYEDIEDVKNEIPGLINYATELTDTRFNFFISRRLSNYLDWIAKNRRIPRAVYLRQLITDEMQKHKRFIEGNWL